MPKSAPRKYSAKLKRTKLNLKSGNRVGLGLTVLFFLILLIVVGKLFSFIQSFNQPYAPDGASKVKKYGWDGKGMINVAVKADAVYLFSFDPAGQSINLINIPDETYLALPFAYGRWPARSVYQLGQNEQPAVGAALFKITLSNTLGLPVDDYLVINGELNSRPFEEVIKDLRQNPLLGFNLLSQSKTDLSAGEYWRLIWQIRGVRTDKINLTDIDKDNLTSSVLLPDGSKVLGLSQADFDQYAEDKFADSLIKSEGLSIGIFNATDHPGLAERAARLVTNLGGRVVFTSNSSEKLSKTLITGKLSFTEDRLKKLFAPDCLNSKTLGLFKSENPACITKNSIFTSSRAEINLVLGEDYFNALNDRQVLIGGKI
jgi:hypothetical protein